MFLDNFKGRKDFDESDIEDGDAVFEYSELFAFPSCPYQRGELWIPCYDYYPSPKFFSTKGLKRNVSEDGKRISILCKKGEKIRVYPASHMAFSENELLQFSAEEVDAPLAPFGGHDAEQEKANIAKAWRACCDCRDGRFPHKGLIDMEISASRVEETFDKDGYRTGYDVYLPIKDRNDRSEFHFVNGIKKKDNKGYPDTYIISLPEDGFLRIEDKSSLFGIRHRLCRCDSLQWDLKREIKAERREATLQMKRAIEGRVKEK